MPFFSESALAPNTHAFEFIASDVLFPVALEAFFSESISLLIAGFGMSLLLCVGLIFGTKRFNLFIDSHTSHKPQRFHTQATPRAGGIGIFVAFYMLMLWGYANEWLFLSQAWQMAIFALGGSVIFASGLIEDFSGRLSPKSRLVIQCVAIFALLAGLDIYLIDLSLGFSMPYIIGLFFSTFALVGVSNAMNIIDGFNGLASGVGLVILAGIMYVSVQVEDFEILYCAIALFVAVLGFFVCNFPFGKIFLGDGGAYFLGFMLGFLLILLTQRHSESVSAFFGLALMIYPIWEVVFSMWRKRIKRKMSFTKPDSVHFHMIIFRRLLGRGAKFGNAKTSLIICMLNLPFIAATLLWYDNTAFMLLVCVAYGLTYGIIYRRLTRFRF